MAPYAMSNPLKLGESIDVVIGVPSASAGRESKHPAAHYQLYGIEQAGNGWRVTVSVRGFDPASGNFRETHSYAL